jgi:hypothetical protein
MLSVPLFCYRDWVSRLERVGDYGDSSESPGALRLLSISSKGEFRWVVGMVFPRLDLKE